MSEQVDDKKVAGPPANAYERTRMHPGDRFIPAMDQNGSSLDRMPNSMMKPGTWSGLTSPDQPGNGRTAAG